VQITLEKTGMSKQEKRSNKHRASASVSSKLNKNLATYVAAAGAAGVSILAMTVAAEAKVIYTSDYRQLGDTFIDFNHDGVVDTGIRAYGFCISEAVGSICGGSDAINQSSYKLGRFLGAPGFTPALFAGQVISPAAQFSAREVIASNWYRFFSGTIGPPNWSGPFANGGKGVRDRYIGVKFNIGTEPHYGWIRVSVNIKNPKRNGFNAYITGYAYETEANTAIIAGATSGPEEKSALTPTPLDLVAQPASLGMLARGADSLALWRRDEEGVAR
jgi:hypothetical protein